MGSFGVEGGTRVTVGIVLFRVDRQPPYPGSVAAWYTDGTVNHQDLFYGVRNVEPRSVASLTTGERRWASRSQSFGAPPVGFDSGEKLISLLLAAIAVSLIRGWQTP